ncbi:hypothetical protein GCM10009840_09420 [Pseudolysinimonas kribbensis]|jgi:hypothetical protein|uniref:Stress-response A/B barrel domain-containing protein n=1 Tax=Pseudolysinimonas kribbensis TaxID=433641 RepID=A0ABQ6K413_9MICO|nr:Dabb family protein [Pseudolysinimonas kribbensis]GMA95351.1 hypothetical protein GCM10025881_21750 [Pseudolysinimonas kribbensis]
MSGVTHVVLVGWRGDAAESSTRADALVDEHLRGIRGVTAIDRGTSVSTEGLERDHDWGMVVRFATVADRDAYLPDPSHAVVADFLGENAARIVVFDVAAGA